MPRARANYVMPAPRQAAQIRARRRVALRGIFRGLARGLSGLGQAAAVLSPAAIQQYAQNAGFTGNDLNIAVAIALAESFPSGNPNSIGDQSLAPANGPSIGLWQINIGTNANPQFAKSNLYDPQTNANAAYAIYSAAGGFTPWTTYTSGKYLAYMQAPNAPGPGDTLPPLTIDASTGLPVTDLTPAPSETFAGLDAPTLFLVAGGAVAVLVLADVLSDL
jgi:Lysozyme like domain